MNKLRSIKIFELRGLIHPIEATIIELLDGIVEVSNSIWVYYRKDDRIYFKYNLNTNNIVIYPPLCYTLNCSYDDLKEIMKYLLKKHLKLEIRYYNE